MLRLRVKKTSPAELNTCVRFVVWSRVFTLFLPSHQMLFRTHELFQLVFLRFEWLKTTFSSLFALLFFLCDLVRDFFASMWPLVSFSTLFKSCIIFAVQHHRQLSRKPSISRILKLENPVTCDLSLS